VSLWYGIAPSHGDKGKVVLACEVAQNLAVMRYDKHYRLVAVIDIGPAGNLTCLMRNKLSPVQHDVEYHQFGL
jgi:hypothetical protein